MSTATKKPPPATTKPKAATAKKSTAKASAPSLARAAAAGQVKFFHRRQSKTLRPLPYLVPRV